MPKAGSRILVLEPLLNGHHGPYLEWMIAGMAAANARVLVAVGKSQEEHPSMTGITRVAKEFADRIEVVLLSDNSIQAHHGRVRNLIFLTQLRYWLLFRSWYRSLCKGFQPDHVFLPYLDYCLYVTAILGTPFGCTPWTGLAMRPSFHYKEMGILVPHERFQFAKRWLFYRLLKSARLHEVLVSNEPLYEYLKRRSQKKFSYLPEPLLSRERPQRVDARARLRITDDVDMLLVYGAVTLRKGLNELLTAAMDPGFPRSVVIYIAGQQAPDAQRLLSGTIAEKLKCNGRLVIIDRYIDDALEADLFSAANAVWLGYKGHYGTSGVLTQAAAWGIAVVACHDGLIGWLTKRYELGFVTDIANARSVKDAVTQAVRRDDTQFQIGNDGCRLGCWYGSPQKSGLLLAQRLELMPPTVCVEAGL